jgi:hypothetical protein
MMNHPLTSSTKAAIDLAASEPSPRNCPLCGFTPVPDHNRLGRLVPKTGKKTYNLMLCPTCDLIFMSPLPGEEDLYSLYVGHNQFSSETYRGEHAEGAHRFYRDRMEALLHRMNKPLDAPIRVLEIGAGLSWISYAAKSLCPQSLTVAQDITPEVVKECTWVDHYLVGALEKVLSDLRSYGPYHVISMTHVIEHVQEPVAVLDICRSLLAPEGIIFITAPHRPAGWNPQSPFRLWEEWSYNHVPGHLQYFNETSLRKCGERAGLLMASYSAQSEDGQALEAWLVRSV